MAIDDSSLFLLLCPVAGPVAAFGHHPACRRPRALPCWSRLADLSLARAAAVFICIAAAALVPWRLHDAVTSRDDVRAVNPVEAAAVSAVVAGMPDPAVLLDRAGRVIHLNAAAAQLAPALRKNELAQFALRSPEIITALREAIATSEPRRDDLSRPGAGRSLDGTDHHAGAGADAVRRHRQMHADDLPRPDAAAPGRGNARRFRRQCQPRTAHAARGAVGLHRYAAGAGQG